MTAATIVTPRRTSPKQRLSVSDLVDIQSLSDDDIALILDLADHYVVQNRRKSFTSALLKGVVLLNVFLENSTRTRLSFEVAAKRLGADVINMVVDGSSLKKGESFTDTLLTLNALRPDAMVLRHSLDGSAGIAATHMDCPVLNAGDGTREHPTQALLDALTLRRHFGRIEGLKIAICGDILHSRVAHSNAALLSRLGADVCLCGPAELLPMGAIAGITASDNIDAAISGADVVMTLRLQKERFEKTLPFDEAVYFELYGLTPARMALAAPSAMIMHPGPMNRGVEIDSALADDPKRSLITTQVEMGVAVRMATLDLLTREGRAQ
jgi:aspartate carbamoyltransferase catalytic subunit